MFKKIGLFCAIVIILLCTFVLADIWADRNSAAGALAAYNYYKQQYQQTKSYSNAWQYARAGQFYADNFVKDDETKKKIFGEAKDAALEATKLAPNKPEGHYWLGANYGSWAEVNGILESLSLADDILAEMTQVIKLSPGYKDGAAFMVRGKVYYKAPSWPISVGDPQKADEDFHKGLQYASGKNRKFYRFYAEYLLQKGEKTQAQEVITNGLALPYDRADQILEDREIALLKELRGK